MQFAFIICDASEVENRYLIEDSTDDELISWLREKLLDVQALVEIYHCFGIIVLRLSYNELYLIIFIRI